MHLETTTFERAIHLLLFVVGGLAFAVGALAVLERVAGGSEKRAISWRWVAAGAMAFAGLGLTEALFHLLRSG
jgi:hypothetical protein